MLLFPFFSPILYTAFRRAQQRRLYVYDFSLFLRLYITRAVAWFYSTFFFSFFSFFLIKKEIFQFKFINLFGGIYIINYSAGTCRIIRFLFISRDLNYFSYLLEDKAKLIPRDALNSFICARMSRCVCQSVMFSYLSNLVRMSVSAYPSTHVDSIYSHASVRVGICSWPRLSSRIDPIGCVHVHICVDLFSFSPVFSLSCPNSRTYLPTYFSFIRPFFCQSFMYYIA